MFSHLPFWSLGNNVSSVGGPFLRDNCQKKVGCHIKELYMHVGVWLTATKASAAYKNILYYNFLFGTENFEALDKEYGDVALSRKLIAK